MSLNIKSYVLIFLILLACNLSCQNNTLPDENNITASELQEAISSDSSLIVLDVRTPPELTEEHGQIEDVINIPVEELEDRIKELEELKDKNFAVICRSGNRSVRATHIMMKNGFNAKNVLGGMKAYNKL